MFPSLRLRSLAGLLPLLALFAAGPARAQPIAEPGAGAVLFPFDDHSLPFTSGLLLRLVPGHKAPVNHGHGFDPRHPGVPMMAPGQPGDPDHPRAYFYGTVLHIDGEYRMWYTGWDQDRKRQVCYAVSPDGMNWTKPKLGLVEYHGNRDNNLVAVDGGQAMRGATAAVLYEPNDPDPNRRFKIIREVAPSQIMAAFSPDGLRWTESPHNPIIKHNSIETCAVTKHDGIYYLNGHGGPVPHPIPGARKRMMVTYASADFDQWTRAAHVSFRRDNLPPRLPSDFEPHRGEQVHMGAAVWHRGNVQLGFYGQYHGETNDRRSVTCDLGLLVSNDALHFREPLPDFKIVPSYEEHDRAEARLIQGQGMLNVGDRTFLYYGIWTEINPDGPTGVRLATWPRDRLGYFEPAPTVQETPFDPEPGKYTHEAQFISAPLPVPATGRVFVNADGLSADSVLYVEILDRNFKLVPGRTAADCQPITQSGLRVPVQWKSGDGAVPAGGEFRVRVLWGGRKPQAAKVYAVYVE